jgi:hypothetical protein
MISVVNSKKFSVFENTNTKDQKGTKIIHAFDKTIFTTLEDEIFPMNQRQKRDSYKRKKY